MTTAQVLRLITSILGLIAYAYGTWQGPFHGKWAEAAFWIAVGVGSEFSARNLHGEDK